MFIDFCLVLSFFKFLINGYTKFVKHLLVGSCTCRLAKFFLFSRQIQKYGYKFQFIVVFCLIYLQHKGGIVLDIGDKRPLGN